MKFTENQQKAISHFKSPALVLAVPGAGKTTVLLNRIKYLEKVHNIDPKSILSITFSKSQAVDMKERFSEKFPETDSAYFSTIHSFCYYIIKLHYKMNNRIFKILESNNDINKYLVIRNIIRKVNKTNSKDEDVEKFLQYYGYCKNMMIFKDFPKFDIQNFEQIYLEYENFKKKNFYIDFDDMLTKSFEILNEDDYILKRIKRKYKFFQVDEGQDTSKIQFELIKKIAYPENNLFIVADDDQSIYSFRGADPSYLLDFSKIFPDASIYYIDQNFRCTDKIVNASNLFIKQNKNRYNKDVTSTKSSDRKIIIKFPQNFLSMFSYLKNNINPEKKTAILYRKNISSIALSKYLHDQDIDFHSRYQKDDFYNHFVLNDILKMIAFSENKTSVGLFRDIYYKLNSYIKKTSINQLETYDESMPILDRLLDDSTLSRYYVDRFMDLKSFFSGIKRAKGSKKIDIIMNDIDYKTYIEDSVLLQNQKISLDLLIEIYKYLFKDCECYEDFINEIENLKTIQKDSIKHTSNLNLLTVHSAKGLEFDEVFIIDLIDGEFPTNIDSNNKNYENIFEEERRMFYVAMTRAKDKLTLLSPKTRNSVEVDSSQFLKDIIEIENNLKN